MALRSERKTSIKQLLINYFLFFRWLSEKVLCYSGRDEYFRYVCVFSLITLFEKTSRDKNQK